MRCVKLLVDKVTANADGSYTVNVRTPPNAFIIPSGPQYVFLLNDGQPATTAVHVSIGAWLRDKEQDMHSIMD